MKTIIKLEEAGLTAISIYLLTKYNLGLPVWSWVLLFFSPDLSMLGYLFGTRAGAFTYNLVHHRGIAILIAAFGIISAGSLFISIGILLFAHSSFDRMLGYGLKYNDDFKHTHLGRMGG
jgi:hypothetical protein